MRIPPARNCLCKSAGVCLTCMLYECVQRKFGEPGKRWLVLYELYLRNPIKSNYPRTSPLSNSITQTEAVERHVAQQLGELGLAWLRLGHREKQEPKSGSRKILREK